MDLSESGILASLIVSSVGLGLYLYGRRQGRIPQLAAGVLVMACPYFVAGAAWILATAGVLLAGLWFAIRIGW